MVQLQFPWTVGDNTGALIIQQPNGNGTGYFQIMIDRIYQGQIVWQGGVPKFYLNRNSKLNGFEILTLSEAIEKIDYGIST